MIGFFGLALLAPKVVAASVSLALLFVALLVRLAQEFPVPTWFVGAAPVIAWAFNAGLFKVIEQATHEQLPTTTKRLILGSFSLVVAVVFVATGLSPLPVAIPGVTDDAPVWFTFFGVATAWIFAGATVIYATIEAAKAVMGKTSPSLPTKGDLPALTGYSTVGERTVR